MHCLLYTVLLDSSVSREKHLVLFLELVSSSLAFVIALCWFPFLASLSSIFRGWAALALDLEFLPLSHPHPCSFSYRLRLMVLKAVTPAAPPPNALVALIHMAHDLHRYLVCFSKHS